MAIRIIYDDREIGCEDQDIGSIHFEQEIRDEATGYDVIHAIVKVMQIAEYHPNTIQNALADALEELTPENNEKDL